MIIEGEDVRISPGSDLYIIAQLFEGIRRDQSHQVPPPRPDVAALGRLMLACHGQTAFFRSRDANRIANALLAISAHSGRWIRQPESWKPRSHNADRQFGSLARHLFARYDVPSFMDTAWLEGLTPQGERHQRWFIHVAQGQNIRTAVGLPIPLTKKQAHHYLEAPGDFDLLRAFRWAQVIDLGGPERLARSLLGTRIATDFTHDEFWVSVIRWLVAHPMLDAIHHGPIIDYLHHHRFVGSVPNPMAHLPGQPRLVPAQPSLTMKGRDARTLLRAMADWHRRLGGQGAARVAYWDPSGFPPFRHEEWEDESRRIFAIDELLSSIELIEEGRAMGHCVGSYAAACSSGRSSIWSLTVIEPWGKVTRLLTLEVRNADRQIVQARRNLNMAPGPKEMMILVRWAASGGPALSRWLAT